MATRVGLIAAMLLAVAPSSVRAADDLADLSAVLGELQKGGLVIYFRHSATNQTGANDEAMNLAKCDTQRELSAEGRAQATQLGNAFKALRIPIGMVIAGPLCRTKDTAQLAFGRFAVNNDLYIPLGADAAETARAADSLRRFLSAPPEKAHNTVIVSHSSNLREATGFWPKPEGVSYVFRPLPGGKFRAIARVLPEDWAATAKLRSLSKSR